MRLLAAWVWPFLRISGMIMTAPVIGTRAVPARTRIILVLALSGVIVPLAPAPPAITDSFAILPAGTGGISHEGIELVLEWSTTLFSGALAIALPIVVALLAVNLSFGVMARAAPQLNVFAVGFPIMIMFGTFMVLLTFDKLEVHIRTNFDTAFVVARALLGGP